MKRLFDAILKWRIKRALRAATNADYALFCARDDARKSGYPMIVRTMESLRVVKALERSEMAHRKLAYLKGKLPEWKLPVGSIYCSILDREEPSW